MAVLWRLEAGTVEQVRDGLPGRYRGAYTTVQTVMNRLATRGLLKRKRNGNVFVYSPTLSESEYVSQELRRTLGGASLAAQQSALAQLVGEFDVDLDELAGLAKEAGIKRDKGSSQ